MKVTNEELFMRIAYAKASGLTQAKFSAFYNHGDRTWAASARTQLHRRGVSDEEINSELENYVDTLKCYMNASQDDRDSWFIIWTKADTKGLNGESKSASLSKFLNDFGVDEYYYRRMRAGYNYFLDVVGKMSCADRLATMNSAFNNPTGKIEFVFGARLIDEKDGLSEKEEDYCDVQASIEAAKTINAVDNNDKNVAVPDMRQSYDSSSFNPVTEERHDNVDEVNNKNCIITISRCDNCKSINITTGEDLNEPILAFILELVNSYLC